MTGDQDGRKPQKRKFVVLTDADFTSAALEHSKTVDILDFVKEGKIDPRYFETPCCLVPGKGGDKPYALLREAIRQTGSVGIGKIIIRYTDYRANLMRMIKAKMKGKKPSLGEPEAETPDSGVLDLMSRLRASLEERNGRKGDVRAKRNPSPPAVNPPGRRKRKPPRTLHGRQNE